MYRIPHFRAVFTCYILYSGARQNDSIVLCKFIDTNVVNICTDATV